MARSLYRHHLIMEGERRRVSAARHAMRICIAGAILHRTGTVVGYSVRFTLTLVYPPNIRETETILYRHHQTRTECVMPATR